MNGNNIIINEYGVRVDHMCGMYDEAEINFAPWHLINTHTRNIQQDYMNGFNAFLLFVAIHSSILYISLVKEWSLYQSIIIGRRNIMGANQISFSYIEQYNIYVWPIRYNRNTNAKTKQKIRSGGRQKSWSYGLLLL